jgi:methanethiol S-methyltransferase
MPAIVSPDVIARAFVWLGGGLFCIALAWCTWWYLFSIGSSRPFSGDGALAVDAALVSAFALHHSLFARDFAKRWLAFVPDDLIRSIYVYVASALFIAVFVFWRPVGGELYRAIGAWAIVGASIQLAGLWLIIRAVARIDPLELAGIRPLSTRVDLQTSGPYRWVRHPLYLGWALAVFGSPHMTGDRLAFAVMSTLYLALAVPWEERALVRAFGAEYERYQREVRWRIVPFIY